MNPLKTIIQSALGTLGYEVKRKGALDFEAEVLCYIRENSIEATVLEFEGFSKECPPLFSGARSLHGLSKDDLQLIVGDVSFKTYFEITEQSGVCFAADRQTTWYLNRQLMVYSALISCFGGRVSGLSFADIGGCFGYCCFHAEKLGFSKCLCVDGREKHQRQFEVMSKMLGLSRCSFVLVNVEDMEAALPGPFDVVSAQGILYHICDHLAFLRKLFRVTKHALILETHILRTLQPFSQLWHENREYPRDNPYSSISMCPTLPVLVEMLREVGFTSLQVVPYPGSRNGNRGLVANIGPDDAPRIMVLARK